MITAAISHSALWLLLVVPALPTLLTLGDRIARGYPAVDVEAKQRFSRILAGIGEQEFALIVQDQTASPCGLRRGRQPTLIASLGFVNSSSDEVLRGVGALEYASLQSSQMSRLNARIKFISMLLIAVGVLLAFLVAPTAAAPFAVLASLPLTMWLTGALLASWSRLGMAKSAFAYVDEGAVDLVGRTAVIDALLAMGVWRIVSRDTQSLIQRVATRGAQPILPSAHTSSRVERIQAREPGEKDR